MKNHLNQVLLNPKAKSLRQLKNSRCGVRGTGMAISGVKCGTVLSLIKFHEAMSSDKSSCCAHCVAEFESIKSQIKGEQA